MTARLEKRVADLEQRADMANAGLMLLIIEYVKPGGQLDRPLDTLRQQDGSKAWQRTADETEDAFKRRVRADLEPSHCGPVLLVANADDEAA